MPPSAANKNPKPGPLSAADRANFTTLVEAAGNGDLALLSAIRKSDGKRVALVSAMGRNGTTTARCPWR